MADEQPLPPLPGSLWEPLSPGPAPCPRRPPPIAPVGSAGLPGAPQGVLREGRPPHPRGAAVAVLCPWPG